MLLVLNVMYQGKVSAQVAKDLHRSKAWACEWLKRYDKEGTGGLKNRQKSGRPPELSEVVICQIKQELKESNKGWTTKQRDKVSPCPHIPHPSKMGIQTEGTKKSTR